MKESEQEMKNLPKLIKKMGMNPKALRKQDMRDDHEEVSEHMSGVSEQEEDDSKNKLIQQLVSGSPHEVVEVIKTITAGGDKIVSNIIAALIQIDQNIPAKLIVQKVVHNKDSGFYKYHWETLYQLFTNHQGK